ncbi:MAG: hypothetical protein FD126_1457 [Elusimicrobia bacterium]|nr:MAG: hypothetical protein FD126_1457 [Elusimicrobiota bacterium]
MKGRLLHAVLASAVVAGAAFGAGRGLEALPKGRLRGAAESWLLEPGRRLAEKVGDSRALKKARKKAEKALDKAADRAEEALEDRGVDADRVAALYTTGAWALAGFVVCFLAVLFLGVSTAADALALGFKVSLLFFFLQGLLVFGAYLLLK